MTELQACVMVLIVNLLGEETAFKSLINMSCKSADHKSKGPYVDP